jgi:hypothetical protein
MDLVVVGVTSKRVAKRSFEAIELKAPEITKRD